MERVARWEEQEQQERPTPLPSVAQFLGCLLVPNSFPRFAPPAI